MELIIVFFLFIIVQHYSTLYWSLSNSIILLFFENLLLCFLSSSSLSLLDFLADLELSFINKNNLMRVNKMYPIRIKNKILKNINVSFIRICGKPHCAPPAADCRWVFLQGLHPCTPFIAKIVSLVFVFSQWPGLCLFRFIRIKIKYPGTYLLFEENPGHFSTYDKDEACIPYPDHQNNNS